MPNDDLTLLRDYAATRSESAFAALVQRHVGLVHAAALRRTGDAQLAAEIAQNVFILLARKAGTLGEKTVLPGWLYRATQFASNDALKQLRRRQLREHQASMETSLNEITLPDGDPAEIWKQLSPVLDAAMDALGESDKNAILLRYFEDQSLAAVGAALGVSEDAALVRVNRALEKLRDLLTKRGVTLGTTAIAGAVTANAITAAPATLATTITAAALTGTSLTFTTIAMTTFQKIAVTAAMTATVGFGIYQAKQASQARTEMEQLKQQDAYAIGKIQKQRDDALERLAATSMTPDRNEKEHLELLKLRGQIGVLRSQNSEMEAIRAENVKLADSLKKNQNVFITAKSKAKIEDAVLADQINSLALQIEATSNEMKSIRIAFNIPDSVDKTNFDQFIPEEHGGELARYFDLSRKMQTFRANEQYYLNLQTTNGP